MKFSLMLMRELGVVPPTAFCRYQTDIGYNASRVLFFLFLIRGQVGYILIILPRPSPRDDQFIVLALNSYKRKYNTQWHTKKI